jgi:hypothetical protein
MTDIAPDVNCPHCGPVIVCPHTMHHVDPAMYIVKPNPPRSDIECWTTDVIGNLLREDDLKRAQESPRPTDSFLENMRRRKAANAARDDWSDYFDKVHARPRPTARPRPPADIAKPGTNPAYVAAAIRKELNQLAATTEGSRNITLAKVACAVFEFVKAGHADKDAAWDELERIATAIGLDDSEIRATLTHQWKKVGPRDVPAPGMAARVVEVEAAELLPRRGTA